MLEKKLEELKQAGHYAIQMWYGEELGCDDLDVPQNERKIVILGYPVGHLGEIKVLWKGDLKQLKNFDFKSKPEQVSNPPKKEEYKSDGYYCWGTDRSIEDYLQKFSV